MNDWIEYDGSGQPVPDGAIVDVLLRHERENDTFHSLPDLAMSWHWEHSGAPYDIVAYRIVS